LPQHHHLLPAVMLQVLIHLLLLTLCRLPWV
jgi:hypothetical protein